MTVNLKSLRGLLGAVAVLAIFALGIGLPKAANDGTLGTDSTGDLDIDLVIPDFIQITDLVDLDLGIFDGTNPATANENICIFRNTIAAAAIGYTVTATTNTGSFILDGNNVLNLDTITFTVDWDDLNGTSGPLTYNTPEPFLSLHQGSPCGIPNANIQVDVTALAMSGVAADGYNALLTLVIDPN